MRIVGRGESSKEFIHATGQAVTDEAAESKGKRVFENAALKLKKFARPVVNYLTFQINK